MNTYQRRADEMSDNMKHEARTIARKVFGCYDWQGMQHTVHGPSGLSSYINRAVIRKIKPRGANWLITEQPLSDTESAYCAKSI